MGYDYDDSPGYDQSQGTDRKRPAHPPQQPLSQEQLEHLAGEYSGLWSPANIRRIYQDMGGWCGEGDLSKFLYVSSKRNLDPLLGEVHAEFRFDNRKQQWQMVTIIHIDALRKLADLTRQYDGQDAPVFHVDAKGQLVACTVTIYRKDCSHPIAATCYLAEYSTGYGNWKKMPHVMLSKCAEAAAFRKAFPAALSGVYISEEMGRTDYAVEPTEAPPSNGSTTAPEPDGLAVGRKANGSVAVMPPPAEEKKEEPPTPTEEKKKDKATVVRSRINAVKEQIAKSVGIKPAEATIAVNTFFRTAFEIDANQPLPSDPKLYAGPLDTLDQIVSDDAKIQALVKDPASAVRANDPLEALFAQWNWQPLTRTAARQTRARLKIKPEEFVLWISSYLKLQELPDKDVLAFFALATYSSQAHRALTLARSTEQSVSNVVHAIEVNLGGDKDFSQVSENELTAAIEKVEALKPPQQTSIEDLPIEDEPELSA